MHTCPQCRQLAPLKEIESSLHGASQAATFGNALSVLQLQAFRQMQETMSSGFSRIESVIRWGVTELQWSMRQQGETLTAIDQTLKTPSETQANEWRLMAEKLRGRGVLDDAAEFYQKALNQNRLDFRIYIGLADTLIKQGKWRAAYDILEKSLPHAPRDPAADDGIADYRSYALRLQGRLCHCQQDVDKACSKLREAIVLSPEYADAHYDFATYAAVSGDKTECTNSLRTAIALAPLYWYLAQKQPAFRSCADEVKSLLKRLRSAVDNEIDQRFEHLVNKCEDLKRNAGLASAIWMKNASRFLFRRSLYYKDHRLSMAALTYNVEELYKQVSAARIKAKNAEYSEKRVWLARDNWDVAYPELGLTDFKSQFSEAEALCNTISSADYRAIRIDSIVFFVVLPLCLLCFLIIAVASVYWSMPKPESAVVKMPESEVVNRNEMNLVLIPAGTFEMGSPESEKDRNSEEQQHTVRITKPFYLGKYEVTQGEWKAVMDTEPWKGKDYVKEGDNYPAVYVSWDDAVEFCKKLSRKEGKTYRLPTEAEWEYACRGEKTTRFHFGNEDSELGEYAWFFKNTWEAGDKFAHRVGMKRANPFGLHDMHGNVWEWCSDWYGRDYYVSSPKDDPRGPETGSLRVYRGGSWSYGQEDCRSANRYWGLPSLRHDSLGFRIALSSKE